MQKACMTYCTPTPQELEHRGLYIQGSDPSYVCSNSVRLAIDAPLDYESIVQVDPDFATRVSYCEVRRTHSRHTCHVCEGGHHVHIQWGSK